MPKVTLNNVTTGFQTTDLINSNNDAIETFSDNTLSRDGTAPNGMLSNLDMNSFRIINAGSPLNNTDVANKLYVDNLLSGVEDVGAALLRSDLLNTSDLAKGDALVGVKRNIANSVASTLHAYLDKIQAGAKKDYGAIGDGVANDTAAIQNLLTDNAGSTVIIEPGNYLITPGSIVIPQNTTVIAYGARLFNTSTIGTLITVDSGVTLMGMEIEGTGNGSFSSGGIGVGCIGTMNGPGVAPTYKSDIVIKQCYIHGIQDRGIRFEFVEKFIITENRISQIAHTGVACLSSRFGRVSDNHINDITPGTTIAYGILFSRNFGSDLVQIPVCTDCVCTGNVVDGVPIWEGLDTHGGLRINFSNNVINNVKIGISLGKAPVSSGGTTVASARQCVVVGNTFRGNNTGSGIVSSGDTAAGKPSENLVISGNVVLSFGADGNDLEAGIRLDDCRNTNLIGNVVELCTPNGINIENNNIGFSCVGNVVRDTFSNLVTHAVGIHIRSTGNRGVVTGNSCYRDNPALATAVMTRGIRINSSTNDIMLGPNETGTCVTKYSLVGGSNNSSSTMQSGIANVVANTGVNNVDVSVTFNEAYSDTPSIVCTLDNQSGSATGRSIVTIVSESSTGFTARVATSDITNFSGAHSYDVHWIAIGN